MRLLISSTLVATLATAVLGFPAQAASAGHSRHHLQGPHDAAAGPAFGSGGYGTGPYWQGEPTDNLPIWRYGRYQGTDPDPFIRLQLMRDPTNR
jgi:hypothetical protein